MDASEAAVGAIETLSGKALALALPDELIGTSSTQRELHAALQVVSRWGAGATGRAVRLCMDSFAATRNLIKGGGPVPALCDTTKQISCALRRRVGCGKWSRRPSTRPTARRRS